MAGEALPCRLCLGSESEKVKEASSAVGSDPAREVGVSERYNLRYTVSPTVQQIAHSILDDERCRLVRVKVEQGVGAVVC